MSNSTSSSSPSAEPTASAQPAPSPEALGRTFVEKLARGDFAGAVTGFDATMTGVMPADKLEATWRDLEKQVGAFGSVEGVKSAPTGPYVTALVTCRFAKAPLVVKVVFDKDQKIAGLFLAPPGADAPWQPPSYAREGAYIERAVEVGTGPALPGTLTLPLGKGPFPVAILVHGSGPSDADETVGAAKPFKDLAMGLASRDVAVLRYVKRTRHFPAGVVGVKEEVLDGAHAAVALCKKAPDIDHKRIFVIGHSQGAELSPRIAAENPGVAGIVMMAPPSRPLQDLVVEQFTYIAGLDPANPGLQKLVADAQAFKKKIEDPGLRPDDEVTFPGGAPMKGAYLLSIRGHDPVKAATGLSIPILVLRGERDYQVTAADVEGYRRALGAKANVTIKQYPKLNHLFIAGEGTPSPAEYAKPGHVDEQVIVDLVAWFAKVR